MSETYSQHLQQMDSHPWYAVRTFNCQEKKVSRFLTEKGCPHFIPMVYTKVQTSADEAPKRILVPAIHNLLFVQRLGSEKAMIQLLGECTTPVSVFRYPGDRGICEIPAHDMVELRLMCDPEFHTPEYMTQTEAEAMVGKNVRVVAGPFKGSIGRLVRKNKQYYFLKSVVGLGVMVRISRWYCEPV